MSTNTSNKTPKLGLSQYSATDNVNFINNYNSDMLIIDEAIAANDDENLQTAIDQVASDLSSAVTTLQGADSTLQGNIDTVAQNLATEVTNRETAIGVVEQGLQDEATARQQAIDGVTQALGDKLDEAGGTISGSLAVAGQVSAGEGMTVNGVPVATTDVVVKVAEIVDQATGLTFGATYTEDFTEFEQISPRLAEVILFMASINQSGTVEIPDGEVSSLQAIANAFVAANVLAIGATVNMQFGQATLGAHLDFTGIAVSSSNAEPQANEIVGIFSRPKLGDENVPSTSWKARIYTDGTTVFIDADFGNIDAVSPEDFVTAPSEDNKALTQAEIGTLITSASQITNKITDAITDHSTIEHNLCILDGTNNVQLHFTIVNSSTTPFDYASIVNYLKILGLDSAFRLKSATGINTANSECVYGIYTDGTNIIAKTQSADVVIDTQAVINGDLEDILGNTPLHQQTPANIKIIADLGLAPQFFNIGDITAPIPLAQFTHAGVTFPAQNATFEIWGFNHDDKTDGTGKAPITFGMRDLLAQTVRMNPTNTNAGGWNAAEALGLVSAALNAMPQEWRDIIVSVNKLTANNGNQNGNNSATIVSTTNSLFMFSQAEVSTFATDVIAGEGSIYAIWANGRGDTSLQTNAHRIKNLANGTGAASGWWLRSPDSTTATFFRFVNTNGTLGGGGASFARGVCLGFCV